MDNTKFKAVILEKSAGELKIGEVEFRELEEGELLVKIMGATINPSDLAFIKGGYGLKVSTFPIVPGFEGSGEIVKVGPGVSSDLIGKKGSVICYKTDKHFNGVWAQYTYAKLGKNFTIFPDHASFDKISFAYVNPLTALGFLDTFKKSGVKTVVQNGASSAFGKMFTRLCLKEGVQIINIVRRREHFQYFHDLGAKYIVSTGDEGWEEELKKLTHELDAKILFDCVGGDFSGKFLKALPYGSTLYHYGNMELKPPVFNTSDFIFEQKTVKGWWMTQWITTITKEEQITAVSTVVNDLSSENSILGTEVAKKFKLEEFNESVEFYLKNRSDGKILIQPNA